MAFTSAATIPWTRIRALSFDIYGTLIDWETGIDTTARSTALGPYLPPRREFLATLGKLDTEVQRAHPTMLQRDIIASALRQYAQRLKVVEEGKLTQEQVDEACQDYSGKIGTYEAFPDTVAAINKLGKHYKLVPLTNVDNQSFAGTMSDALQDCRFDAIYTAEDIGSYKPSPKNFEYLLEHLKADLGVETGELVHVAQSLFHDHGPAREFQLQSVWVNRGGARIGAQHDASWVGGADVGKGEQDVYAFQLEVRSLGELAEIVEAAFGA
ncbi:hypothetical protein LTR62_000474 [Meristemomyces frigidus]|uniref:Haloacid dehalogenase n=1 Tax=Meristemomyces frigidus TaxID=1508187 RepID=A0AAN7TLL7_9PEZI|nr:hypothetical protein LTR62_000474 [Meristemomyces frigidus]